MRKYFTVNIKETLEKTVIIEAETAAEAEERAEDLCNCEDIAIEYDDFSGRTVVALRETTKEDEAKYGVYELEDDDGDWLDDEGEEYEEGDDDVQS